MDFAFEDIIIKPCLVLVLAALPVLRLATLLVPVPVPRLAVVQLHVPGGSGSCPRLAAGEGGSDPAGTGTLGRGPLEIM